MTNINCSSNCVHQKEGKCCLNNTLSNTFYHNKDCGYYQEKNIINK